MLNIKTTLTLAGILALFLQAGCGGAPPRETSKNKPGEAAPVRSGDSEYKVVLEKIRGIVGKQVDLDPRDVDVDVPFSKLKNAPDELDVVEIIMNVEEAFGVEIKDEDIGAPFDEISSDLSVKKLADIVSRKQALK